MKSQEERTEFGSKLLALCEGVAAASGGILGLGGEISKEEQAALDRVQGRSRRRTSEPLNRYSRI